MLRALASRCCLPCSASPSKQKRNINASGEEVEEIVDVRHELINVPYRSEPALPASTTNNNPNPSEQQSGLKEEEQSEAKQQSVGTDKATDTSDNQQKENDDDDAAAAAATASSAYSTQAQLHSPPPTCSTQDQSQAQKTSFRGALDPEDPQKAAARLSYWGPPPYPPPTRQLPAAPVRDPARVLVEQRELLLRRQEQVFRNQLRDDRRNLLLGPPGGCYQPSRQN